MRQTIGAAGRATLWLLVTIAGPLLATAIVNAHAELLRSAPPSGAVLPTAAREVKLWFSEPIEAVADSLIVTAADGTRVDRANAFVAADDQSLLQTQIEPRAPGTYTVSWRAISADGHPINGTFVFSVGRADPAVAAASTGEPPRFAAALQAAGRWLHLLSLTILAGPIVMLLLVGLTDEALLASSLWRLARIGGLLAVPAALVMLLAQATAVTGSVFNASHPMALLGVLRTHWGTLWAVRTLIALTLLGLTHAMTRTRSSGTPSGRGGLVVAIVGISGLLVATALNGHAAATAPVALSLGMDWVHLVATVAWAGGLLALAVCVLPWTRPMDTAHRRLLGTAVRRFSTLALIAIELLVLTGLYQTWAHVAEPEALVTTGYGRALLAKLALLAVTMIPAAVNLLIVRPRLAAMPELMATAAAWRGRLAKTVMTESVLAVAILGAAAVLTSLPGARASNLVAQAASVPAPEEPHTTFVTNVGAASVTVGLSSGQVGSNRVRLMVLGADGQPTRSLTPRLRVEPPADAGLSAWTVTPARDGDGYAATLDLAPAGQWTIRVAGLAETEATFTFPMPVLGAVQLLALADEAMNHLHSMVEDTTGTPSAEDLSSHAEYVAPDRAHRRSGTAEEVVIGATRYMHHGPMWHAEQAEPFRWPSSAMAATARDIVVLGTETIEGQDCLVVQFADSLSAAQHRLWLTTPGWRVLKRTTTLSGRTLTTRYSGFDGRVSIDPPNP